MSKAAVFAIVVGAAACGGSKDSVPEAPAGPSFTQGTIDAAACNALVPTPLRDKIIFEKRQIVEKRGRSATTYTVAAPKNWKQDMDSFADLKADKNGGFFSGFKVGSNCDGMCTAKDWDKIVDKATFQPLLKDAKVLKDVKGVGTRTVIVEDNSNTKSTRITTAWWKPGDKKYYLCSAELDPEVRDAAPAFERACSALTVDGDD